MDYKFIPDTFNYNKALNKFLTNEKFIQCQIAYKTKFEKFLNKFINFQEVQDYIKQQNIDIPRILDEDYNFYHKYSNIGSSYIFIRNNYHVENLENNEIEKILNEDDIDDIYFFNTFSKVIFEEGDSTFFGIPSDESSVNSKSIVFEFAYNQIDCQTIEQLNAIKKIIEYCFTILEKNTKENLNTKCSLIIYTGIPDLYFQNKEIKLK